VAVNLQFQRDLWAWLGVLGAVLGLCGAFATPSGVRSQDSGKDVKPTERAMSPAQAALPTVTVNNCMFHLLFVSFLLHSLTRT